MPSPRHLGNAATHHNGEQPSPLQSPITTMVAAWEARLPPTYRRRRYSYYFWFSSCRGVAFEIKPHADPFAVPAPVINPPRNTSSARRSWLPWGSFSRVVPSSELTERSMSRTSSHFCDLDVDDYEDEDAKTLVDIEEGIEEGKFSQPLRPFPFHRLNPDPRSSLPPGCLVLAAVGKFPYARNQASLFSIANIFALVLCRSEAFLRIVFWLAVNVLGWSWVPLRLKTMTTSLLQCLGGIHSSCGISSVAWLIYALVLTLKDRENTTPEIIGVASTILGLLCLSSLAAFPLVRHLHHNVFERTHRFAGWSALVLLWAFIILTISYDPFTKSYSNDLGQKGPGSCLIPIRPRLHYKIRRRVKSGILGRISPSPFSEWHAFGIISDNKKEHMMLAGAVGDFTKSLVANPPSHLWVRQVHFAGLPYLTNMYNRVLLVATGSGICVFLSFLLQPSKADVCLLWVTKGVEQNFGKEIKEWMSGHPKEKVIVHDTAVLGRPNVSQMSVDTAKNFGAEVVIVTSNPEGSRDVVDACKAAGIAAFGPIWDS
ncbi:UNVERIFIED_CONTAM: hypothetical protein Scaly_1299800 [Sesamum calycinum]|uniref:Integral membrane protein TmpA n=1 Tax=Sesamum calycinum TaxID=2727403 RepID=A0AAW2Q6Q7_9LAMI